MATREDIEKIKQKPVEERTAKERQLSGLTPYKPGQSGNPAGRKKGCVNWSTHFKRLMGDEEFLKTIIKKIPGEWENIVGETPADVIAAALIANVTKGMAKTLKDDTPLPRDVRDAIALISKLGYGDKVIHDIEEDSVFDRKVFNFTVVPSMRREDEVENSESEDSR